VNGVATVTDTNGGPVHDATMTPSRRSPCKRQRMSLLGTTPRAERHIGVHAPPDPAVDPPGPFYPRTRISLPRAGNVVRSRRVPLSPAEPGFGVGYRRALGEQRAAARPRTIAASEQAAMSRIWVARGSWCGCGGKPGPVRLVQGTFYGRHGCRDRRRVVSRKGSRPFRHRPGTVPEGWLRLVVTDFGWFRSLHA
jgi:hypothetical protein